MGQCVRIDAGWAHLSAQMTTLCGIKDLFVQSCFACQSTVTHFRNGVNCADLCGGIAQWWKIRKLSPEKGDFGHKNLYNEVTATHLGKFTDW